MKLQIRFLVLTLTLLSISGCCWFWQKTCEDPLKPPPMPGVDAAFQDIFRQRMVSEQAVLDAKEAFANYTGASLKKKNERLKALYVKTSQEGNSFIDMIQVKLSGDALASTDLKPGATALVQSVTNLDTFVHPEKVVHPAIKDKKLTGMESIIATTGSPIGDAVAGAVEGLAKAGVVIWKAQKDFEHGVITDRNQHLSQELEKRKWQKWEGLLDKKEDQ